MDGIDNPTKWLWKQLDGILDSETLTALRQGFDEQYKRYALTSKIRQCEYEIRLYTKNRAIYPTGSKQYESYTTKLNRRIVRLAKLKSEL